MARSGQGKAGPGHLAAQYCDFLAQDEDLDIPGRGTVSE
jgi:hypothetical protein